jgi:PIN domain nuclease of toxin-antitoxin system
VDERARIPAPVQSLLEATQNEVAVSAVSVWEIAIKRSRGKLTLPDDWPRHLAGLGFTPMPITAVHAAAVESLPWHHRDPFDRLLIAQATVERYALVSADARLAAYEIDVVW